VLGWTWPIRIRRLLGLFAFGYAAAHFLLYLVVDQGLDLGLLLEDLAERPFILVGLLALVLLLPLALTSTRRAVTRLGFRRWRRLHRLAYVAAALGVLHFVLRVKSDYSEPLIYGGILAGLLLVRGVAAVRGRRRRAVR